jgi:hypothetical protein
LRDITFCGVSIGRIEIPTNIPPHLIRKSRRPDRTDNPSRQADRFFAGIKKKGQASSHARPSASALSGVSVAKASRSGNGGLPKTSVRRRNQVTAASTLSLALGSAAAQTTVGQMSCQVRNSVDELD